jgi:hypothetical protein
VGDQSQAGPAAVRANHALNLGTGFLHLLSEESVLVRPCVANGGLFGVTPLEPAADD